MILRQNVKMQKQNPKKSKEQIKQKQVKSKQKYIEFRQLQLKILNSHPDILMKQTTAQVDSNEESDPQQKTFHRILQLYYNSNITTYANMFKKCIPDIDTNYENRMIRKNDKIWVEANLLKIFDKARLKIEKLLLAKNQSTKNSLDNYHAKFHTLSKQKIEQIQKSFDFHKFSLVNEARRKKTLSTLPTRNKSFSIQNVNSEPSCSQSPSRRTVSSKRVFRVRQFKTNFNQSMNIRYMQRLQKVKLESSFAQFFFKKEINPEQPKPVQIQKMYFDKIKAMTSIRWNYKPAEHSTSLPRPILSRHPPNLNNNYLGIQFRKQSFYKPKSKCSTRNSQVFLNY